MKAYIIHVSDAYEREEHMRKQLRGKNLDVTYVTEGDKKELTEIVRARYFSGQMAQITSGTSCAYKHLLAYQAIVSGAEDVAMILEDDLRFYSNYRLMDCFLEEIKERKIENFILSLEDSTLRYVPNSKRVKNIRLYPSNEGRTAGAYLIDRKGAAGLLQYLDGEKMFLPVDWFHNRCVGKGVINIYWCHPAIAVQGTLDGTIASLIDNKHTGMLRMVSFRMQRLYKRLLYRFR